MKLIKSLLLAITVSLLGNFALAQDAAITDLDLRKYAILNQAIEYMKKDISIEVNKMIKAQEGMTSQRFKELTATKGDEAKLAAIEAKDYEKKFLELVTNLMNERKEVLKQVNSELATKMVGDKGKVYKKIKAELKSNAELKARYDEILAQVSGQ